MTFLDPMPCYCFRCQSGSLQPVADLLAMVAACPFCHARFESEGRKMQLTSDGAASYYASLRILDRAGQANGHLPLSDVIDTVLDEIDYDSGVTLADLVTKSRDRSYFSANVDAEKAISTAVEIEYPQAPRPLCFDSPIMTALAPDRFTLRPRHDGSSTPTPESYFQTLQRIADANPSGQSDWDLAVRDILAKRRNER